MNVKVLFETFDERPRLVTYFEHKHTNSFIRNLFKNNLNFIFNEIQSLERIKFTKIKIVLFLKTLLKNGGHSIVVMESESENHCEDYVMLNLRSLFEKLWMGIEVRLLNSHLFYMLVILTVLCVVSTVTRF